MRILISAGILVCMTSLVFADFSTYSGMLRSMKDGRIVLIERGNERALEYSKSAVCYLNGAQVPCERIPLHSQVRVDCPDGKACVRIIVDLSPR